MTTEDGKPKIFDLIERTSKFGEDSIIFSTKMKITTITRPIISQFIRSATSVGANYMEADCAESKKDFMHKIGIAKKESKETMYWLHMISIALPEHKKECWQLRKEAEELTLIFSAITKNK